MRKKTEIKLTYTVGFLIIGTLKNQLMHYCFSENYSLQIDEGFGVLSKPLFITIGNIPEEDVQYVRTEVNELIRRLNEH